MAKERGGTISPEFFLLLILEKFGWNYEDYLNTPAWLLRYAHAKIQVDLQSKQ